MTIAYIGIGANLGPREVTLAAALARLAGRAGRLTAVSGLYETIALTRTGADDSAQPRFLNAVAAIESVVTPHELLETCLAVEAELGRIRRQITPQASLAWEPRAIDIDIISFGAFVIDSQKLTVPHPEMSKRDFVLVPLAEIAPDWAHPRTAEKLTYMLNLLRSHDKTLVRMVYSAQEFAQLIAMQNDGLSLPDIR